MDSRAVKLYYVPTLSKVSIRNYPSVRKKKLQIKKSETDKRTISIYLILKLFTFIARKIEIGTTRLPSRRRSHIATGSSAIFYGRKKKTFLTAGCEENREAT